MKEIRIVTSNSEIASFDRPDIHCVSSYVQFSPPGTLDDLLAATPIPRDFDLLSIDIDGNDYHVWRAVTQYSAHVVVIEFNPTVPDDVDWVQEADPRIQQGSSAAALYRLGREKGYEPVAITQTNIVFVRREFFAAFGISDNSLAVLRRDRSLITHIFFGYDGTVLTSGYRTIPWHQIPLNQSRLQHLPRILRSYPDDYGRVSRLIYRVIRKVWAVLAEERP